MSTAPFTNVQEYSASRDNNVPFFPPPPTSSDATMTTRHSRPPPLMDKSLKIQFNSKPRRKSNLRHTTGYPTQTRKRRLQELHLPAINLSPRHWLLTVLMLLSFVVLILGVIFASCVALPHTDNHRSNDGDNVQANLTLYARDTVQTTPAQYEADEAKDLGFTSSKNLAILFFYTATLPLLTILHALVELTASFCCSKHPSSSSNHSAGDTSDEESGEASDSDSISRIKTLTLATKHKLDSRSATTAGYTASTTKRSRVSSFLTPHLPMISLTVSLLLVAGWIVITAIQAHCEIPLPSTQAESASQAICPVQIRGHFMHGIHELSIVRNVFGWLLVAIYVAYAAWCVRLCGELGRARERRRLRRESERVREEQLRRSAVVRFSLGKDGDGKEDDVKVEVHEV